MTNIGEEDYDFLYKIVLAGQTNVGKTHIVQRYIKNTLPKNPAPTIGVEFATRVVPLSTGGTVKAQIWDTAGQQRYHAIVSAHYRRALGALLVYDVTDLKSFSNAKKWIEQLKNKADPDIIIMLVGNKIDLVQEHPEIRQVQTDQAQNFAKRESLLFIETSAVAGQNVKEAFEVLLEEIAKKSRNKVKKQSMGQGDFLAVNPQVQKKSCC